MTPGPLARRNPQDIQRFPLPGRTAPAAVFASGAFALAWWGMVAQVLGPAAGLLLATAGSAAAGWWFTRRRGAIRVDRQGRVVVTGAGPRLRVPREPAGTLRVSEQPAWGGSRHVVTLETPSGQAPSAGGYRVVGDAWRAARALCSATGWPLAWAPLDGQPLHLPAEALARPWRVRADVEDAARAPLPEGATRAGDGTWRMNAASGSFRVLGGELHWEGTGAEWRVPLAEVVAVFAVRQAGGAPGLALATSAGVHVTGGDPASTTWAPFIARAVLEAGAAHAASGAASGSPVAALRGTRRLP